MHFLLLGWQIRSLVIHWLCALFLSLLWLIIIHWFPVILSFSFRFLLSLLFRLNLFSSSILMFLIHHLLLLPVLLKLENSLPDTHNIFDFIHDFNDNLVIWLILIDLIECTSFTEVLILFNDEELHVGSTFAQILLLGLIIIALIGLFSCGIHGLCSLNTWLRLLFSLFCIIWFLFFTYMSILGHMSTLGSFRPW